MPHRLHHMSEQAFNTIPLDEKVKAESLLYASMFRTRDRNILLWAFLGAAVLHMVFLVVPLPKSNSILKPDKDNNVVFVRKYVPPPPKIERKQIVKKKLARKIPIPDPMPDAPEPIREPEPEFDPELQPPDTEIGRNGRGLRAGGRGARAQCGPGGPAGAGARARSGRDPHQS